MFYMLAALSALEPEKQRHFAHHALGALRELRGEVLVAGCDFERPMAFDAAMFIDRVEDCETGAETVPMDDVSRGQRDFAKKAERQGPVKKVEPKARPPPEARLVPSGPREARPDVRSNPGEMTGHPIEGVFCRQRRPAATGLNERG